MLCTGDVTENTISGLMGGQIISNYKTMISSVKRRTGLRFKCVAL